ncbi:unnamed protein product [Arctia plantaginis]|uniref:Uncharacterized protein n=1 Tax=Arctia plantaginis TaxID=874455 RepID=A0A8S1A2N2_ARCPL|nr:unnamed protein product [Arctia plantaginis]
MASKKIDCVSVSNQLHVILSNVLFLISRVFFFPDSCLIKNVYWNSLILLTSQLAETMTKGQSITDSEIGSEIRTDRVNKLGAILCPTVCALLLVCIFAVSFIGTKLAYEQYDTFCTGSRRFDVGKLYIFPNFTITFKAVTASVIAQ